MTFRRTRSRQDPFKVHAGYHILEIGVLIGIPFGGIKGLKAGCHDDAADIEIQNGLFLIKVNGVIFAELFACLAFTLLSSVYGLEVQTGTSINGVLQGNGLGKRNIYGLAFVHAHVEFVGYLLRALGGADPASHALVFIDIPRMLDDLNLKVSLFTADAVYLGEGDEIDVGVPADLDQLG